MRQKVTAIRWRNANSLPLFKAAYCLVLLSDEIKEAYLIGDEEGWSEGVLYTKRDAVDFLSIVRPGVKVFGPIPQSPKQGEPE